jgi:hypothetical protein
MPRTSDVPLTGWAKLAERLYRLTHGQIRTLVLTQDQVAAQLGAEIGVRLTHGGHKAKTWAETNFPAATGTQKAALILAYGAGLDAGLAEAQEIIAAEMGAIREQRPAVDRRDS